jgi:hypothetical protein
MNEQWKCASIIVSISGMACFMVTTRHLARATGEIHVKRNHIWSSTQNLNVASPE